jgi:hypothetical protein
VIVVDRNGNSATRAVATLRATASQRQTQQSHRKQTIFNHNQISLNQPVGKPLPGRTVSISNLH